MSEDRTRARRGGLGPLCLPRLLFVDDEQLLVEATAATLADSADVLATTDPFEALASIEAGDRYDTILLDVNMPNMDGVRLLEHIAAISPSQAGRVVFMTAGSAASERHRLSSLPNPLLEKPIDLARIRELLWTAPRADSSSTRILFVAPQDS